MTGQGAQDSEYAVGRGIADITGEPAECGMLGYGKADQRTAGIHLRQRVRAFVITAGRHRILLVVAELPLLLDSVRQAVLARLAATYGATYSDVNTMLTCTHTHAGPGGYGHHALYNATTNGFHPRTFTAIVDGIVQAVTAAHDDLAPASLELAMGELRDASVNRSPTSFALDPADERAFFPDGIDPQSTLLTIRRGGTLDSAVNWFATHGTSMSNRNRLISSDNKGYAALRWERHDFGVDYLSGSRPAFVSAFAQTNAGDMSPNLDRGPGRGPASDEFTNTRIIGSRQYTAAAALVGSGEPVSGGVDARLTYLDLSDAEVAARFCADGRSHRTSGPYAGAGQVAGTDEGKGFAGFRQGRHNPVFDGLSAAIYRARPALRDAQAPKGLVLPRSANRLVPLVQERVPVQLLRIGALYLIGIPGEVTIVAGLRLRRAVASVVGAPVSHVLVAGYANGYIHYVTTPEEYAGQRYEAASTMYGRWELGALTQAAVSLAEAMAAGRSVERGTPPPDLSAQARARDGARIDEPVDGEFGAVLQQPRRRYRRGDTVRAAFVGANPNNDLRHGSTYLVVEEGGAADEWTRVADDGDWSTRLHWVRAGRRGSRIEISWDIPPDAATGTYRIGYRGDARRADGSLYPIEGRTTAFAVE